MFNALYFNKCAKQFLASFNGRVNYSFCSQIWHINISSSYNLSSNVVRDVELRLQKGKILFFEEMIFNKICIFNYHGDRIFFTNNG